MCGLAGFISDSGALPASAWPAVLGRMGDAIRHRGPDDHGIWMDEDTGLGFVHRRLSVLDLSPAAGEALFHATRSPFSQSGILGTSGLLVSAGADAAPDLLD